jgi:chromosome segregation ATPase
MSDETTSKPSFLTRMGRFILRLIFIIIVGIALGAGIYYGVRAAYRQFIEPVQEHTLLLAELEARQEETDGFLNQRLEEIVSRLDALEIQGDISKETFADLEDRLEEMETDQVTRGEELITINEELLTLQSAVSDLTSTQEDQQESLDELQTAFARLDDLRADLETASQAIEEDSLTVEALLLEMQAVSSGWQAMLNEFQMLKAMELLTRSRVNLVQGNLSLARGDIAAAHDLLVAMLSQVSVEQVDYLEEIVDRLDAALDNLPRAPIAAADEVEGAWQLLLEGLPVIAEQPESP